MMTLPLLALALVAPLARPQQPVRDPAPAEREDARQILWQRSLEDALALQRATGRPILVAVNTDAESASERIVRELYRDPAFVEKTRSFVCLVASPLRHTPRDHDARGRRVVDPRFGEVTSGEAVVLEPALFERWLGGDRIAPRHALVLPDGTKAFDLFQLWDLSEVDRALAGAVAEHGAAIELEPPVPERLSGDPEQREQQWRVLAAARSNRNRGRLEELLTRCSPTLFGEALDAIAQAGDAGSLDALRVVLARSALEGERNQARIAATARALGLGGPTAFALWEQLLRVDRRAGEPGLALEALLLPLLGELHPDLAAMAPSAEVPAPALSASGLRSLLLSQLALGAQGAGLEQEAAARALEHALEAQELARVRAALDEAGGPFDLPGLWRFARAHRPTTVALPSDESLRGEEELNEALLRIEEARRASPQDPDLALEQARVALELARVRLAAGAGGADLLLEDSLAAFELALRAAPDDVGLRLEAARAAYELGRFEEQERLALEALSLLGPPPPPAGTWTPWEQRVPASDRPVEAHRWLGDAAARLVAGRFAGDPAAEALGMLHAGRSLALVAAGPEGSESDWTSLASLCGALGRRREELACTREGLERWPASDGLRALLQRVCAAAGRPELAVEIAADLARAHPESASCAWYLGFALVNEAEWLRRGEDPTAAIDRYARADDAFQRSAELEPDFAASCEHYRALGELGLGFARLLLEQQRAAADALVRAVGLRPEIAGVRDGLDREALDLLDGALEWRAAGPSPVAPLDLALRLLRADPGNAAWPRAVSDSELREALRADGRGAPEQEVEAWLDAALAAGRLALELDPDGEATRRVLAQALTVRAERRLLPPAPEPEAVAALLAEAAPLMGLERPAEGSGPGELGTLSAALRGLLGEARPVPRPGR